MRDKELYTQILSIHTPWQVADVELSLWAGEKSKFTANGTLVQSSDARNAATATPTSLRMAVGNANAVHGVSPNQSYFGDRPQNQ